MQRSYSAGGWNHQTDTVSCAGFFVVYQFFHLPSSASLADLEEAGKQFCNTPWSRVNAERGAEIHVDRYCFRWACLSTLLAVCCAVLPLCDGLWTIQIQTQALGLASHNLLA